MIEPKLNASLHKAGSRYLVTDSVYYPLKSIYEIQVVEWSPSGRHVKIKYTSGMEKWTDEMMFVIEELPNEKEKQSSESI